MVTEYKNICAICGKPAECTHHLVFGRGMRALADKDKLTMPMCNGCHNMAESPLNRIHGNPMAEHLSKIIGQLSFELNLTTKGFPQELAREEFRKRYGRSYL